MGYYSFVIGTGGSTHKFDKFKKYDHEYLEKQIQKTMGYGEFIINQN